MENLDEVSEHLNKKYKSITDFNTIVCGDCVIGGFYKMNFLHRNPPEGEYYLHETFGRLYPEKPYNVVTYTDLYDYLDQSIQRQLIEQKKCDEDYAKEFGKKIEHKFNYSVIDA